MRLFVAFEIPEPVRREVRRRMAGPRERLRVNLRLPGAHQPTRRPGAPQPLLTELVTTPRSVTSRRLGARTPKCKSR